MNKKANTRLAKVIALLNDGQYHDGTTLGDALEMTRSAIWKIIKKLQSYGIQITSTKGKGYALVEPVLLLELNKIKKNLKNKKIETLLFESIDSTNDYLKSLRTSKTISFCLAEQQTRGKGRLGRQWYSPFGKNIYVSCRYVLRKEVSELAGLSLVTSLAVIAALKSCGLEQGIRVKWPNDIFYADKKLAGILIEIQAESHGASVAVIGIGMNVNTLDDEGHISQPWTSLRQMTHQYVDRNSLVAALMNHLMDYMLLFEGRGFAPFVDEWTKTDYLYDQTVTIKNIQEEVTGKVKGINEQGHLLLQLIDGQVRAFSSGDASLVKRSRSEV